MKMTVEDFVDMLVAKNAPKAFIDFQIGPGDRSSDAAVRTNVQRVDNIAGSIVRVVIERGI